MSTSSPDAGCVKLEIEGDGGKFLYNSGETPS